MSNGNKHVDSNEFNKEQLDFVCEAMHVTVEQAHILEKMLEQIQPWEASFVVSLINDRVSDRAKIAMLDLRLEQVYELGGKLPGTATIHPKQMPPGYFALPTGWSDSGNPLLQLFGELNSQKIPLTNGIHTEEEAIKEAFKLDKFNDPHRWRSVTDGCPSNEFLIFACVNWEHSVKLGKPVPVKLGYINEGKYRVFGASWTPTHWCYPPEGPKVEAPAQITSETLGDEKRSAIEKLIKARLAYNAALHHAQEVLFDSQAEIDVLEKILNQSSSYFIDKRTKVAPEELTNIINEIFKDKAV